MSKGKRLAGGILLLGLIALTFYLLLRNQPVSQLLEVLGRVKPGYVVLGLGLMFVFVGSEAMAAVGSTSSLISLLVNFFIGISVGANVLVARFRGANASRMAMSRLMSRLRRPGRKFPAGKVRADAAIP